MADGGPRGGVVRTGYVRLLLALLLVIVVAGAAACGGDESSDTTTAATTGGDSAFCAAVSELESDVETLKGLGSGASVADVAGALAGIRTGLGDLRSAASSDPDLTQEVDDVSSSVDALEGAATDIAGQPIQDTLASLGSSLTGVSDSLGELKDAARCE